MEFSTANELSSGNFVMNEFLDQVAKTPSFKHLASDSYPANDLDVTNATHTFKSSSNQYALYQSGEAIGFIYVGYGDAQINVAAISSKHAKAFMEEIKAYAPKVEQDDPKKVDVTFWSLSPNGPQSIRRSLDVPLWEDLKLNYNQKTLEPLSDMMKSDFRPGRGGQLFLWHGEPGTGKTTALRALGRQWRDWCELHYIVDPEKFFGSEAAYMMQVLLGSSSGYPFDDDGEEKEPKWRLLILEDCGELLSADARSLSGQGLSRFLNAVDGLIGQGLRIMVLVTTNEEMGKLHAAVQRPGRCAANIEFHDLTRDEVKDWIKSQKIELESNSSSMSIAELYALCEGRIDKAQDKKVGFGV